MLIETKIVGRRIPFESRALDVPEGTYSLRELLKLVVQAEVAAYQERQNSVSVLRVLTERELADGAASGKISISPQERAGVADLQEATETAMTAFKDGLYYVFVDEEQIEDLLQMVTLRPQSTLLFLRLTALAGG